MEAKFQIFLILLAVLAGTALAGAAYQRCAGDPAAAGRHRAGLRAGNAVAGTAAGTGAAGGAAAADLFGQRRHELARIQIQSAPDHPAFGRLRDFHGLRGRRRDALPDRAAVEHRLPARRHRRAAGCGGAAGDRPQARAAAPDPRHPRGRGTGERRHRADPVSLRGGGDFDRDAFAAEGNGDLLRHRRRRGVVRRGGGLAQPADAPPRARSPDRDHAVADHALHRLLDPGTFRRLRRDRHRRLRALHELERAAVDLLGDAAAGHLLLGPRDLPDRGSPVPADRLPDALAVREVQGVSARRYPASRPRWSRSSSSSRASPGSIQPPTCRGC